MHFTLEIFNTTPYNSDRAMKSTALILTATNQTAGLLNISYTDKNWISATYKY
jgi:hypothetical protein